MPSAAATRWEIAAALSSPTRRCRIGGLGRARFDLSLRKNRRGPSGRWIIEWDHHERALPAGAICRCGCGGFRPTGSSAARPRRLRALVVVASIKGAQRIAALNDAAARLGLKTGMALADARAMYPALPVVEADSRPTAVCSKRSPTGATATRRWSGSIRRTVCCSTSPAARICSAARRRSPAISCARLARRVSRPRRGRRHGRLRLGRGALWQAGHRPARRNRSGRAAAADRGAARRCRDRRGSESRRPHPHRRSGRAPARAVRRALRQGAAAAASTRRSAARTSRSRRGCRCRPLWPSSAFPIRSRARPTCSAPSSIWRGQLADVLERRGEGGRLFQVALFRADGKVHRLEIGTGAPLRDPARIRKLFEERLAVLGDACDPGFGYDMVRLSALVTERSDPAQTGLGRRRPRRGTGASDRPARRALRPAPRDAAGAAGHAYSGIRGGGGAGACAAARRRGCHAADRAGLSFRRPSVAAACAGRSRSRRSPRCRTARRSGFPGGTSRIRSRRPKGPNASPWNGGATTAATS